MSYRVKVNDVQLFGNNEHYPEWDEYIRSQGITINQDGDYDGEIHDFHAALLTCEAIAKGILKKDQEHTAKYLPGIKARLKTNPDNQVLLREKAELEHSLLDFSGYQRWLDEKIQTLMDINWEIVTSGYMFMPFALYLACRDQLEPEDPCQDPDGTFRIRKFRFKPGVTAHVHAG